MKQGVPSPALQRYSARRRRTLIGLMSGTSLDGIDAALITISGTVQSPRIRQQAFLTVPLPRDIRAAILGWYETGVVPLSDFSRMHARLGRLYADAVLRVCRAVKLPPERIHAVGSHGLTVWHQPQDRIPSTLQIGDGSVIARRTGIITVSDFRPADMAAGGEGAPLIPAFDAAVFRSDRESRALLNIGGIANWTIIPRNAQDSEIFASDTGPGNMVIDALMRLLYGKPFDRHGRIAAAGCPSLRLMMGLLAHPFLRRKPPKSTGREEFGPSFVEDLLHRARKTGLSDADIIATVTTFTAETIGDNYRRFVEPRCPVDRVIVSGGGAHNHTLLADLEAALPDVRIDTLDEHGMSPDAKEAIAFAWLADRTLRGLPGNHPPSTGARCPAVLGKIALP